MDLAAAPELAAGPRRLGPATRVDTPAGVASGTGRLAVLGPGDLPTESVGADSGAGGSHAGSSGTTVARPAMVPAGDAGGRRSARAVPAAAGLRLGTGHRAAAP